MNKSWLFIGLLVLAVLAVPGQIFRTQTVSDSDLRYLTGNVVQAASCSQQDVQAAINAAGDGDFVLIPAGHCTWNVPAAQTPSVIIDNKAITLQGAGIDQTIIADGTSLIWNEVPLRVNTVLGKHVRITGFTLVGQGTGHYDSFAAIAIYGSSQDFRVDHIKFDNIAGRSISVSGKAYGVIDHCEFIQPNGQGVIVTDDRGDPQGSTAWEEPMSFGAAGAVFIEDSLFQWSSGADGAIDCGNGGRYVFRHNTVEGIMVGNHGLDTKPRSCMQMEIYHNTFLPSGHAVYIAVQSRGGTALVFDNTITGSYQLGIGVTNYRSCCYAGAACTPSPDPPFGTCDGTNALDGNISPSATYKGWPCKDQIGRGTRQSS
ncbi:MAG TPA: right-handed parallel beta-helix repeat-containing protein, partial [Anaerolineae bacterium]|nr:right-handed parallel beta-helix repeat-containing protein [Anaerolineae bacterium]